MREVTPPPRAVSKVVVNWPKWSNPWRRRRREVHVVEDVEGFQTNLELDALPDLGVLDDRKILIEEVRH